MQELAQHIRYRILKEVIGRAWSFVVPQIPCLLIFLLFCPEIYVESRWFLSGAVTVVLGTILMITQLFHKEISRVSKIENVLTSALLLVSIGWTIIVSTFFHHYGIVAQNSLITLVIICGITAGGFVLLTPSQKLFYAFFLPMFFIPSLNALWIINNLQGLTLVCMMALYNLFLILSSSTIRVRHKDAIVNEFKLVQEKEKIEGLINAFPGIVSIIDNNEVYQLMNKFGLSALGRKDVIGKPLGFMTPNDELVFAVRQFMANRELDNVTKEIQINTGKGLHWFLVSINRLPHPAGWVVVISVMIDELVNTRRVAEEQKAKADYTARLASLGEMAQGVAHEINNPLAVVMFSADEIHQRAKRDEIDREFIENFSGKIIHMSQRISKIVKALRYFSRDAEKDPIKTVPLSFILNQTVDFRSEKYKNNGVEFNVDEFDPDLMVEGREVQLMQALINLLNNAFDAAITQPTSSISIKVAATKDKVFLRVYDSGPGIPLENQSKIFEPFFTTKEVNQGHGLGLSIALGLMQGNGGTIRYIPGPETCFEMEMVRGE